MQTSAEERPPHRVRNWFLGTLLGVISISILCNLISDSIPNPIIIVISWITGMTPPPPQTATNVAIKYPNDGSLVDFSQSIGGTVSNQQAEVWVLIKTPQFDHWVQGQAHVASDRTWKLLAQVGRQESLDAGKNFEVIAVANPKIPLSIGAIPAIPSGDSTDSIIVTRR